MNRLIDKEVFFEFFRYQ